MTTVCVFGGTGFLGRRLVRRLAGEGASVRVAVRSLERARSVLPDLDRVEVLRADVREPASVAAAVAGADAVVNAVSAYVEKAGVSFESVHVQGARTLAQEAAAAGVARLVIVERLYDLLDFRIRRADSGFPVPVDDWTEAPWQES